MMLFDGEERALPSELLERLKAKAKEVAAALRETKEANLKLTEEVKALKAERDQLKGYLERYESERQGLKSFVDELLEEFEKV